MGIHGAAAEGALNTHTARDQGVRPRGKAQHPLTAGQFGQHQTPTDASAPSGPPTTRDTTQRATGPQRPRAPTPVFERGTPHD